MSAELPIIASDIEPNEIVKKYNLGIMCDHNEDSYSRAFLKITNLLDVYSNNCRKVKEMFSPNSVFKDLGEAISGYL